jgi:flagellar hook assembly protein FlgD
LTDANVGGPLEAATFTLADGDVPYIAFHLHHQAQRLTVDVVNDSGRTLGRAVDLQYLPRNATAAGAFVLTWDGTYLSGNGKRSKSAPDGRYTLKMQVDKPLAERNNPAHVETWVSPSFTIDRP